VEKAGISEKALAKVSADLNAERAKAEATQKEYPEKVAAHTTRAKHSLDLNKMSREKNAELDGKELNLEEAYTQALNPRDSHDELMELVELWRLL
jgi:recombinational DNA repair ATPase RecF